MNKQHPPGAARLDKWLSSSAHSAAFIARAIGAKPPSLSQWRSGKVRPTRAVAAKLEVLTDGFVRESDWTTADERAAAGVLRELA